MSVVLDIFSIIAIGAGAFFFFAGTVGLLRFPDALTRLHALTKADNLGLGLVVLGLLPRAGSLLAALKLIAIWVLVQLAGATVCAAHCARRAPQGADSMSVLQALDLGLAALVLAVAGLDHRRAPGLRRGRWICRLWIASVDRLGSPLCGRCGADGGRNRQWRDGRAAHWRRFASAGSREGRGRRTAQLSRCVCWAGTLCVDGHGGPCGRRAAVA